MKDPIHGNTIQWKYEAGQMAGKSFEHEFKADGSVTFKMDGGDGTTVKKYETEQVSDMVFAVSYIGPSGWTLTSVLDFDSGKVVSFASNEKQLMVYRGEFHVVAKHAA